MKRDILIDVRDVYLDQTQKLYGLTQLRYLQ